MSDNVVAEITKLVEALEKQGGSLETSAISKVAEQISKAFDAKPDEVAVLALAQEGKFLRFIVPEKLQKVGDIPMTSTNALAVRTARDKRPEVINNFATARHPTVFEAVPLGQQRGDPIQKIMSAPISADNRVMGVVQVSRKGKTVTAAGPDFSPKDLSHLVAIGGLLARCLKLFPLA
jgi:GAF domain-containing protein